METRHDKARQVASAWLNSAFRGDTAVTTALSDVPFALDRKRTILSIGEVEALLEEKGERKLAPLDVKVVMDEDGIWTEAFPASYVLVFLQLDEGGDGVTLCVKPGDTYKVVGVSDRVQGTAMSTGR